jgi:hypothetical protein
MYTLSDFRQCIAEQSDSGMLIAADWCDEQPDQRTQQIGTLLRRYVEIQTYVRMSQPIPLEMANEFKAINDSFEMPLQRQLESGFYAQPLGPFYTELVTDLTHLVNNLNLLSIEPIRVITITRCYPNDDLALILRNYRMDCALRVTLGFAWNANDAHSVAQSLLKMKASQLNSLTITNVEDRLKMVISAFHAAPNIRKGAELFMSARYNRPERVAVKK